MLCVNNSHATFLILMFSSLLSVLPPSLNFLSITGDHCEGEILTASYGYIGGHEGKSLYNWFLHEVYADCCLHFVIIYLF